MDIHVYVCTKKTNNYGILIPVVVKWIVSLDPSPFTRHVTAELGNCSEAMIRNCEIITVFPPSTKVSSLVATVVPLVLFLAGPTLDIGKILFTPMKSVLFQFKIVAFLDIQVKRTS